MFKRFQICILNLSSLQKTRAAANSINERVSKGDLPPILLNTGLQDTHQQDLTVDGIENTFAVNYLYQFLLVLLLPKSMDKRHGRIIVTRSTTFHNRGAYVNEEKVIFFTSVGKLVS
jgi:NAD(P)-dependent dehydrogenase (short-subunit alcohol dehydrogenase family)